MPIYRIIEMMLDYGTLFYFIVFTRLFLADWFISNTRFKGDLAISFYESVHCFDFQWLLDSTALFPPLVWQKSYQLRYFFYAICILMIIYLKIFYCYHAKYMPSDWSRRVQYWPYCTLCFKILHFDKQSTTFGLRGGKNMNALIRNKLITNH